MSHTQLLRVVRPWMFAVIAVAALASRMQAQGSELSFFHHQAWSTEEGLPQASVHAMLQDRDGSLWLATEGGAARFDGQSFSVLNRAVSPAFASDDVTSLAQDREGALWFGTLDGLVRKKNGVFARFSKREGLPNDEVLALAPAGKDLLVLTTGGLAVWRNGSFAPVATGEAITSLRTGGDEAVLVSGEGRLLRWHDGGLAPMPRQSTIGFPLGAMITRAAEWVYGANFVEADAASGHREWHAGKDFGGSRIQVMYVDKSGAAWVGTNKGLFVLREGSPAVMSAAALSGESVLCLLEDKEGDIWIGTEASGLQALQLRKFTTVPGTLTDAVTTVVRDSRGVMYFGTREDGLFRAAEKPEAIARGKLTSSVVLSLAAGPRGELWVGTPDGLNRIEGAQVHQWTVAEGLPDDFVRSVAVAADGTAWAGTRAGLVHVSGDSTRVYTTAEGLPSNSIGPVLTQASPRAGEGLLWVGTSAGLARYEADHFRRLSFTGATSEGAITALASDSAGTVWTALHGAGLALVAGDKLVPVPSEALPREILGILADKSGTLWLRALHGVYRAPISDLERCVRERAFCTQVVVAGYGRADGMSSEEVAGAGDPLSAGTANGEVWFGTRRGITIADPKHFFTNAVAPEVAISRVQVDGAEVPLDTSPRFGAGHRQYSFEYAGVSLNNASRMHFRYMLEGFEHAWVDAGTRRTGYYTNLAPGRYVLRVMAANSDGLWSQREARFAFEVLRPWYRRLWAYALALCLAAALILLLLQLRVRTERRRFALVLQERTRVAREVHDTLAQDLVSVSLQVELAAQHAKAGRLEEVTEDLGTTRALVRQALESARQSIWNLRANLPGDSLPVRLAARVDAFRAGHAPARLRIGGEYRPEPPQLENEVMRIASETISNVERHARATELMVDLHYGTRSLQLQIRDNGRGFDPEAARALQGHYGLRGLEERSALLQGDLRIESTPGQGTTVTLIAPLGREDV